MNEKPFGLQSPLPIAAMYETTGEKRRSGNGDDY